MVRPHNLPLQLTSFLGREREVAELARLLREARLVTLTGVGGTGKTRLALAVAAEALDDFDDGVFFVDLAPLSDPALAASAIAQVLGVADTGARPLAQSLAIALHDRTTLLLLDNFEHLMPAASLVAELLAACPRLRLLVTSREALRLTAEQRFPVPPLPLPDDAALAMAGEVDAAALQLFAERARAQDPAFRLTDANRATVAAICARLEGLPLAIELAAGRVRLLPPGALLARLERRLPLLVGGARDAPLRQQTLRNAIAWSYDLLRPEEQALLRRLAVFVGGFGLETAEAVGAGEDGAAAEVLEGIATLAEHSPLQARPVVEGEPRFGILETIREFALERLTASGEEVAVRNRHARALLALAEASDAGLKRGQRGAWAARLKADRDNLQVALSWLQGQGEIEAALNLVGALWSWFSYRATQEDRRQIEQLLALPAAANCTAARARALASLGSVTNMHGSYRTSAAVCAESAALWREVGDHHGRAFAQSIQACALSRIDPPTARALAADSVAVLRSSDERWTLGFALHSQALSMLEGDDLHAVKARLEEAVAIFMELDDPSSAATSIYLLAHNAFVRGDDAAVALAEQATALHRAAGSRLMVPMGLELAGRAALRQGGVQRAEAALAEALRLSWKEGTLRASLLSVCGQCASARGAVLVGVQLIAAAYALEAASETRVPPEYKLEAERALAVARGELGDAAYEEAWREGGALTAAQAVAAALALIAEPVPDARAAEPPEAPAPTVRSPFPDRLTAREVEVLGLIAAGKSTREIAAALVISDGTVERHVTNLYGKIGATNRVEAAAYAQRHDLVAPSAS